MVPLLVMSAIYLTFHLPTSLVVTLACAALWVVLQKAFALEMVLIVGNLIHLIEF